jgi:hypothetical protein
MKRYAYFIFLVFIFLVGCAGKPHISIYYQASDDLTIYGLEPFINIDVPKNLDYRDNRNFLLYAFFQCNGKNLCKPDTVTLTFLSRFFSLEENSFFFLAESFYNFREKYGYDQSEWYYIKPYVIFLQFFADTEEIPIIQTEYYYENKGEYSFLNRRNMPRSLEMVRLKFSYSDFEKIANARLLTIDFVDTKFQIPFEKREPFRLLFSNFVK